jgi:hypothetical protein
MNKVRKQIVITSSFCDCENCPKYYYDMEDGDLCILMSSIKRTNKFGHGIPEWCPLDDYKE